MEVKFTIDKFEGPLDLLLHLIKENDIDIMEINISEITEQYLTYIKKMEELDLNVSSEYLVLAAELTLMKSKTLLPSINEEEELDPREELINRLVLYQKYKEVSQTFKELELDRNDLFTKKPSYLSDFKDNKVIIDSDITIEDLIKAFTSFNQRKEYDKPLNTTVTKKEYSVSKRSYDILKRLKSESRIIFSDLFEEKTKGYVVVTFLSILDLTRKGKINITQDKNMGDIFLTARGEM
jgi:segregation and condensation protein A